MVRRNKGGDCKIKSQWTGKRRRERCENFLVGQLVGDGRPPHRRLRSLLGGTCASSANAAFASAGVWPVGYRYHPPTLWAASRTYITTKASPTPTPRITSASRQRSPKPPIAPEALDQHPTTSTTVPRKHSDKRMADSAGAPRPSSSVKLVRMPSGVACRDGIGC